MLEVFHGNNMIFTDALDWEKNKSHQDEPTCKFQAFLCDPWGASWNPRPHGEVLWLAEEHQGMLYPNCAARGAFQQHRWVSDRLKTFSLSKSLRACICVAFSSVKIVAFVFVPQESERGALCRVGMLFSCLAGRVGLKLQRDGAHWFSCWQVPFPPATSPCS